MSFLLLILMSLVAGFWLRWRYKNRRLLAMAAKLPGPPTVPVLGNALLFIRQPEGIIKVMKDLTNDYGDVLRFWLGPDLNIIISDPDDLKILLSNVKTSVKGPQYKYMADVLGGGILSGSGATWRKHRKIATPNYGKRAIESYSEVFNTEAGLLLHKLRSKPADRLFDIYYDVVRTTSVTVCQTLMGLSREETLNVPFLQKVIDDTPRLYDIVFNRMTKWYLQIYPVFWLSQYNKDQNNFMFISEEFSKYIVARRLEKLKNLGDDFDVLMDSIEDSSKNTKLSVIDRFILSRDLNADELLKETFTIFTSSQEASAKISSFLILMMAYHPACQEKLYAEINSIIGSSDRPVTDEDLKNMPYLEMVFKEVLRLFPIGAVLQRSICEEIKIGSYTLPAGCSLVAPIYHLHRDARFWSDPDAFDPERFTPENSKLRHPCCYIPFSLGPMDCLGSYTLPAGCSLVAPIYHLHRDARFWSDPDAFDPERFTPENSKLRHPCCYIPFSLGPMDCLGRYFGTKLVKTICVRILREFQVTSFDTYRDLKLMIAISVASINGFKVMLHPRTIN